MNLGKFKMWSENGKYYYKHSLLSPKKEISKERFHELLEEKKVTSIELTSNNQPTGLYDLFQTYQKSKKEETSEFGRRVSVHLVEGDQAKYEKDGEQLYDVTFKLNIVDEKTQQEDEDLYTITLSLEGFSGPLVEKEVYVPEAYRSFYQLAFNGALATEDDIRATQIALKTREEKMV